jgi:hypothetical protein
MDNFACVFYSIIDNIHGKMTISVTVEEIEGSWSMHSKSRRISPVLGCLFSLNGDNE